MLVDSDPLVGKGVDAGNFRGKIWIHQVAEGEPFALGQNLHDFWGRREIENGWRLLPPFTGIEQLLKKLPFKLPKVGPK